MFPRRIRAAGSECRMCISALPALVSCRRASLPKCSRTQQKAEQRDFRHAVLSKPYKPVLCAATRSGAFFHTGKLPIASTLVYDLNDQTDDADQHKAELKQFTVCNHVTPHLLRRGQKSPPRRGKPPTVVWQCPKALFRAFSLYHGKKYLSIFSYCLQIPPVCAIIKPIKKPET